MPRLLVKTDEVLFCPLDDAQTHDGAATGSLPAHLQVRLDATMRCANHTLYALVFTYSVVHVHTS